MFLTMFNCGGYGSVRSSPVLARKPSRGLGRYCIGCSRAGTRRVRADDDSMRRWPGLLAFAGDLFGAWSVPGEPGDGSSAQITALHSENEVANGSEPERTGARERPGSFPVRKTPVTHL